MKVYIKNIVCDRCIMVVKNELEKLGFRPMYLKLGEVELERELNDSEKLTLNRVC